jgi:hypothetical protein
MDQIYESEEERKAWLENDMRERLTINAKGDTREVPTPAETIISKPQHKFGYTTFSQYIAKAKENAEFMRAESMWSDEVKIDIQTPYKWFAIQPWGDFHIGSHGCDYDKLTELLAGPMQYENLKTIILGNLGDFFTPMGGPRDGGLGDVMTPETQMVTIKKFLTENQDSSRGKRTRPRRLDLQGFRDRCI